jgi:uncharacterized protein
MGHRVHILTLGVKDIERAKRFYEKVFGWTVSSASNDHIIFFHTPGIVVALYPRDLLAEDVSVAQKGSGFTGVTFAHNVPEKTHVAEFLARAESADGRIVKPAQDVFWGGHSGYFADLDGHLWEVAWNPHFTFAKDGSLKIPK